MFSMGKYFNRVIASFVCLVLFIATIGLRNVEAGIFLLNNQISSMNTETIKEGTAFAYVIDNNILTFNHVDYTILEVEGGDRSGYRDKNVAVDIGFGDRIYWGLTNEYGQLVYVLADAIIVQNDDTEPVNSSGRYYNDEANVPGTEHADLDQGHIIADSLGGVANAYNITPQDSILNRHGNQAYMEKGIRDVGGCTNFFATITYLDESTQIPTKYRYEYSLDGTVIIDEFENVNPDDYNEANHINGDTTSQTQSVFSSTDSVLEDVSTIDTNGNGTVTIKEAEAAGFKMPITSDHWLYQYMKDGDGDGMVGE